MGSVYHIFVPDGGAWRWVATVPAPVTREDARRALLVMGSIRKGQSIRMVRVDDSPQLKSAAPDADAH